MPQVTTIRLWLVSLALLAAFPAYGQYSAPEAPRWRITGFAGFDLSHTSQSINEGPDNGQLFPLGDLRLNTDGFLLDPRFLHIDAGMDFQKGVNSAERGDLDLGGLNLALGTVFLPKSHVPLRTTYTRTSHGVSGLGLNQNDDDSRLDVEWSMLFPSLPHITAGFQKYDTTVHVPTSFADRSYNELGLNVGVSDAWKQWQWAGNFATGDTSSSGVSGLDLTAPFEGSSRTGSFSASRNFWENKARLRLENRELWRHDTLGGAGSSDSSEFTDTASFNVQLNPQWSVDSGYSFSQLNFQGSTFSNLIPGAGQTRLIALNSGTSHTFTGRVNYRPTDWLRLSQEARTTRSTPAEGLLESETSFTDTSSTVSAEHRWHGFDLNGSYTGRFQLAGTTLDRSPSSWSNSFIGRIGWGDVRYVRLSAVGQDSHLNLVEQIGGFTQERRVGFEAETHQFKFFRLRASADRSRMELLNVSGNTRTGLTSFGFQAEHRLFSVSYTRTYADGAGALFPFALLNNQFLVIQLPVGQLLATPLLDRTTHAQSVSLIARPRRRLDVVFVWRQEETQLTASDQTFSTIQADARYHLGRVTLEGGYSRSLNDVMNITGLVGNRLARWYLRVGRDFRIF